MDARRLENAERSATTRWRDDLNILSTQLVEVLLKIVHAHTYQDRFPPDLLLELLYQVCDQHSPELLEVAQVLAVELAANKHVSDWNRVHPVAVARFDPTFDQWCSLAFELMTNVSLSVSLTGLPRVDETSEDFFPLLHSSAPLILLSEGDVSSVCEVTEAQRGLPAP
eukprot:m.250297 g.250297  ORF g.250297 m.250297 type:complete len:168 (-) comp16633_c0_seq1:86-589(-)